MRRLGFEEPKYVLKGVRGLSQIAPPQGNYLIKAAGILILVFDLHMAISCSLWSYSHISQIVFTRILVFHAIFPSICDDITITKLVPSGEMKKA